MQWAPARVYKSPFAIRQKLPTGVLMRPRPFTIQQLMCASANFAGAVTPRPALGLVMILKNEAGTIARTIESIRPHIDFWTVVDTGSSDETRDIVAAELAGVPGQLLERPFEDFAVTRNWALRAHDERTGEYGSSHHLSKAA